MLSVWMQNLDHILWSKYYGGLVYQLYYYHPGVKLLSLQTLMDYFNQLSYFNYKVLNSIMWFQGVPITVHACTKYYMQM